MYCRSLDLVYGKNVGVRNTEPESHEDTTNRADQTILVGILREQRVNHEDSQGNADSTENGARGHSG